MYKILKNANILYAFSNILFLGTLFLVDIYIARTFPLEKVGSWKQLILLIQFTALLLSLGVIEGFRYIIAKDPNLLNEYLGSALLFIIIIGSLLGIPFIFSDSTIFFTSLLGIDIIAKAGFLIPLLYILLSVNLLYQQICLLKNQIKIIFFVMLTFSILFPITLFMLLKIATTDFSITIFLSFIFIFAIQTFLYVKKTKIIPVLNIKGNSYLILLKRIITYGFPLFIATYIGILTLHIDKVIVNKLGGITAFAIYSVGALEIPIITLITKSFINVSYPKIVTLVHQNDIENAKLTWIKDVIKASYISYPIICLLIFFSDTIITSLFGTVYKESIPIFKAYCLILLWRNGVYGTIISVKEKTFLIAKYSFMALIVNVLLSFILYYYLGLVGIIYSTFLAITFLHILFMKYEMVILEFYKYFLKNKIILFLLLCVIVCYFT